MSFNILLQCGVWNHVCVDSGREFALMLFVQPHIEQTLEEGCFCRLSLHKLESTRSYNFLHVCRKGLELSPILLHLCCTELTDQKQISQLIFMHADNQLWYIRT